MRGTTAKKIRKFVDILMKETPEDQQTKSRDQLIAEVKVQWRAKGKQGQKFVNEVVNGLI